MVYIFNLIYNFMLKSYKLFTESKNPFLNNDIIKILNYFNEEYPEFLTYPILRGDDLIIILENIGPRTSLSKKVKKSDFDLLQKKLEKIKDEWKGSIISDKLSKHLEITLSKTNKTNYDKWGWIIEGGKMGLLEKIVYKEKFAKIYKHFKSKYPEFLSYLLPDKGEVFIIIEKPEQYTKNEEFVKMKKDWKGIVKSDNLGTFLEIPINNDNIDMWGWIVEGGKMGLVESIIPGRNEIDVELILRDWILELFPFMSENDISVNEYFNGVYGVEIMMFFDPDEDQELMEEYFSEIKDKLDKLNIKNIFSIIDKEAGQFVINFEFDEDNYNIWGFAIEGDKMNLF